VTLANLVFSIINVSSFEDAWPLKLSGSSILQWFGLKCSDQAIWQLADPTRSSSVFHAIMVTTFEPQSLPTRGLEGVSTDLAKTCSLDESSTADNNPYFVFVHGLSRLLEKREPTLGEVFMVVGPNPVLLRAKLEMKDPVALILLFIWYRRARKVKWWIEMRARYEIPAIRTYLKRYHADMSSIQAFLDAEPIG
jgi:hypothetical protein